MKDKESIPLWKILGCEDRLQYIGMQFMNRETTDNDLEEMAEYEAGGVPCSH